MSDDLVAGAGPAQDVSLTGDGYIVHEKQPETVSIGETELFYQDVAVLEEDDEGYDVIETETRIGVRSGDEIEHGPDAVYEAVMEGRDPLATAASPAIEGYEGEIAEAIVDVYDPKMAADELFDAIAEEREDIQEIATAAGNRIEEQALNDVRASFGYTPDEVDELARRYIQFAINEQLRNYDEPDMFTGDEREKLEAIEDQIDLGEMDRDAFQQRVQRKVREEAQTGSPFDPEAADMVRNAVEEYLWQQRRDGIDYRSLLDPEIESEDRETITEDLRAKGYTTEGAEEVLDIVTRQVPEELVVEDR